MKRSLKLLSRAALVLAAALPARAEMKARPIELPGGGVGVGLDDVVFARRLGKLLVPGGRTGKLFAIDPLSLAITEISGFAETSRYAGGHGEGTTSADEGPADLYAIDRTSGTVDVVDPVARAVVFAVPTAGDPDYVRHSSATGEVWVTEPDQERIEVFTVSNRTLVRRSSLHIRGGPESLVLDAARQRAYTNTWKGETVAVELKTRKVAGRWLNGCAASRGLALDEKRGFVFVGCAEGRVSVLDASTGARLSEAKTGYGVDGLAYSPALSRVYVPGSRNGTLTVLSVGNDGKLEKLRTARTSPGAHCAAADDSGQVWVCDPDHGRLLLFKDEK